MVKVELTKHLFAFFPKLEGKAVEVEASTVAEVVREMERLAPGFAFYVCDERGRLRRHVNIFVGEEAITDRKSLSDRVEEGGRVWIMQALSGGRLLMEGDMTSILVGSRKGAFIVENEHGRWRPRLAGHAGVGVNFVAKDPHTGTLWAALGHGHWGAKLSRSKDGGAIWEDATQIKYPEGARYLAPPEPTEDGDGTGPTTIKDATLLKLWVIAFGEPGKIYVGTIPGGLFVSADGGESFELNRPLWNHESRGGDLFAGDGTGVTHWFGTPASEGEFAPGIHSVVVDPRNPRRVLVAVSTAGVLETTDGGETWRARNRGMLMDYLPDPSAEWGHDPHYIELCAGQPDHVWQQNHCGVFYSDDGAATWRKVSSPAQGVHFGFPVTVDPEDGKTAWLVPGKADSQRMTIDGELFVARTLDGGETWEEQREGLPQENAYDVVYRHALSNADGVLAFGSTTGNLYVSENGGETWLTVANNLPPIYSVRFG